MIYPCVEWGTVEASPSFIDILLARYVHPVHLFDRANEGWSGELPFYLAHCATCRQWFVSRPHGFEGELVCPNCSKP